MSLAPQALPRDTPGNAPRGGQPRRAKPGVAALVGSSAYRALSDDALKDEDNAAWVLGLQPAARAEWLRRIHWIRLVDRLAENERLEPGSRRFGAFVEAFRRLLATGVIAAEAPHAGVLAGLRDAWLGPRAGEAGARSLESWVGYLDALADYHRPGFAVRTLEDHDAMLFRLSGHIFQLVPYLTAEHHAGAGELGRLDQFFNNLRDLQEDGRHGLCYLPASTLARFGLGRDDVLGGGCLGGRRWEATMRFWLDDHLPALRARSARFVRTEGLHPSLAVMRWWTLRRHARIERVFREVRFDYRQFPARYWAAVRVDLASRAAR